MRGLRYDHILASTALALVLSLPVANVSFAQNDPKIEAGIPVPEAANVPPPTAADIGPMPAASAPAAPAVNAAAPAPAAPATTATAPAAPATTATAPSQPENQPMDAAAIRALTGKDLVKAPIASGLAAADVAVAEKLRDMLATKGDRYFGRKNERPAVEAFYRDRGFAPLWIDKGAPSARATAVIAYLRGVEADGMVPEDYALPEIKPGDAEQLAEAEFKYTATVMTYARHAEGGRVHFTRVSADILYPTEYPDPATLLTALASNRTIGETLASYQPQQPGYKALKAKLAEARAQKGDNAPDRIEHGAALKTGKVLVTDPRVPALRKRLGLEDGSAGDITYDRELELAVQKFQKERGLPATGQLTNATVDAINGPRRDRDADIIVANMERWRWLPRDLGKAYVMLNIPDFTLKVMNDGHQVWTTRVVTGKPGRMATPMLTETMKFITVNPTWNVPPSIVNNEYLPALQQDPTALERIGLKVVQNPDGTVRIYQPPGAANALGRIRFNFPNKFLVYQHDTPDKNLFAHEVRAYSHGCMRVQNPDKYAEVLLNIANPKEGWTADRIQKMYGSAEQNINFQTPIPVHITYQSAFVDDAGKLQIRNDIYGRDAALLGILKSAERRNADTPIERTIVNEKPQVARLPGQFENPFSRLFGGWGGGPRSGPVTQPSRQAAPQTNARPPAAIPSTRSAERDAFFNRIR